MIERATHTITQADGTIIKHPIFVTDNNMVFDNLAELTCQHECWALIKPHEEQEWNLSIHGFQEPFSGAKQHW